MTPLNFWKTLYVGDRLCSAVVFDGRNSEVLIAIDSISRVRGATWDYYNDENVDNGYLVIEGVRSVEWAQAAPLPNDWIELGPIEVIDGSTCCFHFQLGCALPDVIGTQETELKVIGSSICIQRPDGVRIRD